MKPTAPRPITSTPIASAKAARLRVGALSPHAPTAFDIRPDSAARQKIARDLDLPNLPALRFAGQVAAEGDEDWRLDAHLSARVVQPCVVTLAPVTTDLEEDVSRRFLAQMPDMLPTGAHASALESEQEEVEIELPEDENIDPLGREIDLWRVMVEALALALPLYPRAEGAALGQAQFAADGVTPLSDADLRPFAGLAALRDKLGKKE